MPRDTPDWLVETPIAHRGLHGDGVPENSIEAIERAVEAGYAVEIDVRLSRDGVPVVFHDVSLERLTGHTYDVADIDWEDLGDLTILDTSSRIPRLERILEVIDGQVGLLVELKNRTAPGALEARVRDLLVGYEGPVAVQSFNPRSVAWFARHAPELPRGQVASLFEGIPMAAWKRFLVKRLLVTPLSRPDVIAYEHSALPYWPVTLHQRVGVPVLAWTVRSPAEHERVGPHADNVIFEGFEP